MPTQSKYFDVKVYVACALTYAPENFKISVAEFKKEIGLFCTVLEFLGLTDGTPRDVYQHDIHNCVMKSDLVVAIVDLPSTGLGFEMAVQSLVMKNPLLAFAHNDSKITRLILDPQIPGYTFHRYSNFVEIYDIVKEKVKEIHNKKFVSFNPNQLEYGLFD